MACKSCSQNLSGYESVGKPRKMKRKAKKIQGMERINYMQILSITAGYIVASKVDSKIADYYKTSTTGMGAQLKNEYVRSAIIAVAGGAAIAYSNMEYVEDMGKGAIVLGIKNAINKAMPTYKIGNPNSVPVIGNPNSVAILGNPNSVAILGDKTVKQRSLQLQMDKENPNIQNMDYPRIVGNDGARIVGNDGARIVGNEESNIEINY